MQSIMIILYDISLSNGTERAVSNLIGLLNEAESYKIICVSCYSNGGVSPFFIKYDDLIIEHLNFKNKAPGLKITQYIHNVFFIGRAIKNIGKILEKYHPSFIIGTNFGLNIILPFMDKEIKKIACEHFSYSSISSPMKVVRWFAYKLLDRIVLLTQADVLKYHFLNIEKIRVIPNSMPFSIGARSADLNSKRIIALGRLTYQKGFDLLLQACIFVKEAAPDWHIDIYGDGECRKYLIDIINRTSLADFVSIHYPKNHIENELLASSIYVLSSRFEGLPMALIEAQICGLPCISFDCPTGPAEIIHHGFDGYLVDFGNIKQLADRILDLIYDIEKRKKMGGNAQKSVLQFSPDIIKKKWISLLDGLSDQRDSDTYA
jgi:glycosyltransferase involved in cell wall biosynthesis